MPELPEVETVARGLARRIRGLVVENVFLSRADILRGLGVPLCAVLRRRRVVRVRREGKQVRIAFDGGLALVAHLGMTGRMVAVDRNRPVEPHTHLRITFRDQPVEMRFCDPRRFGGIWLVGTDGVAAGYPWIGRRLPPVAADPLRVSLPQWRAMLKRRKQIKGLLLDQDPITGVGNIYCDESLHRASIHPLASAADLSDAAVGRLYRALRQVLREAIRAGGSSVSDYRNADDTRGWFQVRHRVYGREGQPCRRCRTPIRRLVVAGRGTHLCPRCQRRPR